MSNNIYIDLEEVKSKIDISRLKRDYSKFPLITTKNGIGSEFLSKEELEYLYIELNLHIEEIAIFCHISYNKVQYTIAMHKIKKPEQLLIKQRKNTNIKKYNCEYGFQSEEIKEKIRQTNLERYGVKNYAQTLEYKEKSKQTCLEKYGCDSYTQSQEFKNKAKETNLKKYGVNFYSKSNEWKEKIKNTSLEKYGKEYYTQTVEYKEKSKQTCLDKYGVEFYSQTDEFKDKFKETCLKKYGFEFYSKTIEYLEKIKKTNLERYGCEWNFQSKNNKEKSKQTCLDKYGVEFISQTPEFKDYMLQHKDEFIKKIFQTKKKNNSFGKSKEEEYIYELLCSKYKSVKRQYKSDLYPFPCDFYIEDIDTYIEYQGYWTHGNEPYNENNQNHKLLLENWKNKNTQQYIRAINTWTISDPLKRKTAKENNLNYLEFFNLEQFLNWFNN